MATPHVAGVVALLLASEPGLTPEEVRARIMDAADPIPALDGITVSGARLNAANTLAAPQPGTISGTVWDDTNNNGSEDTGEPGLSGVTVYLDANQNGGLDGGELTAITNGSGQYTFANVAPGSYHVAQVVPAGFTQTAPLFTGDYVWSDSNSVGGPAYSWFDISSVGTALTLSDASSATMSFGSFSFSYFGQVQTSVTIGSNGYLTFGGVGNVYTNLAIPNVADPDAIIAPFWDDLNPARGGDVYYFHDTANDRFIVEYDGLQPFSGTGNYTFQAILNGDGSIEFQYNTMTGALGSATISLENPAGDAGAQVSFNDASYMQNNLAMLFSEGAGSPTFNDVVLSSGQNLTGVDFGNHNLSGGGGGGCGGTNDSFVGTSANNVFDGGGGDDAFLLRFGKDTATGGAGADEFKVDGRYLNDGDAHRITDLNFGEGDTLILRLFDTGAFSNAVDPSNHLGVTQSRRTATFNSLNDILGAHDNGVMQASDAGDGSTLLTMPSGLETMTLQLDTVAFSSLGIGGVSPPPPPPPPDPSPGNDTLAGGGGDDDMFGYGGNDGILLRYGNDTTTGGTGADRFTMDGRYVYDGDSYTITDLDFSEGDYLEFRFMDNGTFNNGVNPSNHLLVQNNGSKVRIDSQADLIEVHDHGVMTGADDGFGGTTFTVSVGGDLLTFTLDG